MIVQKYQLLDEIGAGSFSTVYKAQHTQTKQLFAIKKMREMPHNNFKVVQNEIQLLKRIQHKNIVRYQTDFKIKGKWYIVFQYCGKGDLQNFRNKQGKLPQAFCKNLAYSLVDALKLLHQNKIVHRDLKLANILINDNYDFKLADFGFSKDNLNGIMQSFCGTPYAMSPEILNREEYDQTCDTWSLGVMIYQLIYGKLPFLPGKQYGHGIIGVTNCIMKSQPKYDSSVQVSEECKDFIKLCLIKNRHERPKMVQLKKHSWINNGVQSQIRRQILMNSLADKTQAIDRAKQLFNGCVNEHIVNLIKHMKLVGENIKWNLKTIQQYFPQNKSIKSKVVMMIGKKIQQLMGKIIQIEIDGRKFHIELNQVKSFMNHIQSLKQLLSQGFQPMDKQNIYLQRQLISFLAKQAHACLRQTENYPQKIKLISNLSQLPIKQLKFSKVQASWSFNQDHIGPRKQFNSFLQNLNYQQIYKFINQSFCQDNIHQNWLIDHKFYDQNQQGTQIQLGQFISRVIQINYNQND